MVGSFTSTWGTAPTSVPVAVPGVRLAVGAAALHTDRCHSLCSLTPPPAAVASLPILDNRTAAHKCINIEPTKQSPNRPLIDPYFCSILYRLQESPKAV